eukprot:gene8076-7449_t
MCPRHHPAASRTEFETPDRPQDYMFQARLKAVRAVMASAK